MKARSTAKADGLDESRALQRVVGRQNLGWKQEDYRYGGADTGCGKTPSKAELNSRNRQVGAAEDAFHRAEDSPPGLEKGPPDPLRNLRALARGRDVETGCG